MADRTKGIVAVHPMVERLLVILLTLVPILAIIGAFAIGLAPASYHAAGHGVEAASALVFAAALAISWPIDILRHMRAEASGGKGYDQLRGQQAIRIASMLVQMLQWSTLLVLAFRLSVQYKLIELDVRPEVLDTGVRVVMAAFAIACTAALWESLRVPSDQVRTSTATIIAGMALALATILAAVAAAKAAGVSLLSGLDPSVLDLMAFLALAIALVRIRALPTLTRLAEERGRPRSGESASRPNAVLLPALIAFALLLVVFLLFVIFGVGAVDTLSGVGHNPFVLGIIGFLLLSITASLALAMTLARTKQRRQQLYIVLPDAARQRRNMFLGASIIGSSLFGLLAAAAWLGVFPHGYAIHFLSFGLMFGLGPYGLYAAAEQRRIRRLEERFPDYLRDLAASHMGGLTLSQSAITAAKGEYGELTPEIRKVADQLSWNVSFSEALARLAERVHTPLVQRAVNLILQADRSGGSTTDVLLAAARDAREIKTLETERRIAMSLYTIVVYVTFFVFLGVVAILYSQFAPQIIGAGHDAAAAQSSDANADLGGFGLGDSGLSLGDYQLFYYLAALVQGIGDGIVAGLLGNGKAVLGLRHAFLMVLFSYFTFLVLLR